MLLSNKIECYKKRVAAFTEKKMTLPLIQNAKSEMANPIKIQTPSFSIRPIERVHMDKTGNRLVNGKGTMIRKANTIVIKPIIKLSGKPTQKSQRGRIYCSTLSIKGITRSNRYVMWLILMVCLLT